MPNRDGTGPSSQGAGTGRKMGPCYNNEEVNNLNVNNNVSKEVTNKRLFGLRNGQGRGQGLGRRCCGKMF